MPVNFLIPVVVCEDTFQPETKFDYCDPTLLLSEIEKAGIGNPQGAAFTDITDATELMDRISQTSADPDAIRELTVIGEKTAPTPVTITASNGRTIPVAKDNALNLTIDEITDENWNYGDYIDRHPIQRLYYFVTQSGKMFHFGNEGILVNISVTDNFPTGRDSIITLVLAMTWRSKPGLAKIADYPLVSGGTGSGNIVANPGVAISNQTNNGFRVSRTGATTNIDAYIFQLYSDAGRTQQAAAPETIPASGNAFKDYSGLVSATTYYPRIVPVPAAGYTAPTGGVATAVTTNNQTVKVFNMAPNANTALPQQAQIDAGISVTGPVHGPIIAPFPDSLGTPLRPTLAYVTASGFNPDTWTDTGTPSNTGPIGSSTAGQAASQNVFDKIGTVGIYTIVQTTSDTDFDGTTVSFTE